MTSWKFCQPGSHLPFLHPWATAMRMKTTTANNVARQTMNRTHPSWIFEIGASQILSDGEIFSLGQVFFPFWLFQRFRPRKTLLSFGSFWFIALLQPFQYWYNCSGYCESNWNKRSKVASLALICRNILSIIGKLVLILKILISDYFFIKCTHR